jgi:hypothetical protein
MVASYSWVSPYQKESVAARLNSKPTAHVRGRLESATEPVQAESTISIDKPHAAFGTSDGQVVVRFPRATPSRFAPRPRVVDHGTDGYVNQYSTLAEHWLAQYDGYDRQFESIAPPTTQNHIRPPYGGGGMAANPP